MTDGYMDILGQIMWVTFRGGLPIYDFRKNEPGQILTSWSRLDFGTEFVVSKYFGKGFDLCEIITVEGPYWACHGDILRLSNKVE